MTSTTQTSSLGSSNSTIYYPPPSRTPGAAANPVDLLPRQNTSVSFIGTNSDGSAGFAQVQPLPSPGPEHYLARRQLWISPPVTSNTEQPVSAADQGVPPTPTEKIAAMISSATSIGSEELWNRGLRTLSNGLLEGHRLRKPLGMDVVIKILHATWLRDGTWPANAAVPPPFSDDELPPQTVNGNGKGKEKATTTDSMEVETTNKTGAMLQDDIVNGEEEEDEASEGKLQEGERNGGDVKMRVVER